MCSALASLKRTVIPAWEQRIMWIDSSDSQPFLVLPAEHHHGDHLTAAKGSEYLDPVLPLWRATELSSEKVHWNNVQTPKLITKHQGVTVFPSKELYLFWILFSFHSAN